MNHYIYIHQNKLNKKIYVGYSSNPKTRWQQTKSRAFDSKFPRYNEPFYCAIRKYGWDSFDHQIIEKFDDKEDALRAEIFWIEFFRSNRKIYGKEYGHNLHRGGSVPPSPRGRKHTEEFKKNMSERQLGSKNHSYGKQYRFGKSNPKTKGYCFHKQSGKWQVAISLNGKIRYLGLFTTEQEAIETVTNFKKENFI